MLCVIYECYTVYRYTQVDILIAMNHKKRRHFQFFYWIKEHEYNIISVLSYKVEWAYSTLTLISMLFTLSGVKNVL